MKKLSILLAFILPLVLNSCLSQLPKELAKRGYIIPNTTTSPAYKAVDLGLSVKWADCNIGSKYGPKGEGTYLQYGMTKEPFNDCYNLIYYEETTPILPLENDAAHVIWGGNWRIPTVKEFEELINRCNWEYYQENGHGGYKVTGPNGNYIFLPCLGVRVGRDTPNYSEVGCYWASNSYDKKGGCVLYFTYGKREIFNQFRYVGLPIRPVLPY